MSDEEETADFPNAEATKESPRALYCNIPGHKGAKSLWVPKSVIHDDSEVFDAGENSHGKLVLKMWFAEKEGLI